MMHDRARTNHPDLWTHCFPRLAQDGHKYDRGHALIVGGYPMTGAARLAALAAARIGAGLTTIAVPEVAFAIYASAPLSIVVHPLRGKDDAQADFGDLIATRRFSAALIGPGAGVGDATRTKVSMLVSTGLPVVLDADALTRFADDPAVLFGKLGHNVVLTPHEGEFERLFGSGGTRLERANRAAQQSQAVVVLKGAKTVIAAPDGTLVINENAPPTLATAGSGDVLSGIITGLLAQGMPSFFAAAAGVWIHGAAATMFGRGLIADDLPAQLPAVLCRLLDSKEQI